MSGAGSGTPILLAVINVFQSTDYQQEETEAELEFLRIVLRDFAIDSRRRAARVTNHKHHTE